MRLQLHFALQNIEHGTIVADGGCVWCPNVFFPGSLPPRIVFLQKALPEATALNSQWLSMYKQDDAKPRPLVLFLSRSFRP